LMLTLQEVSALEDAISSEKLSHWGWKADKIGRISTESGQVVFRAGFVSAVQKTVKHVADF
ncbi:MAG: gamma-mobile-trio protein GmtX, partial [Burkholderiales bacterium]